MSNTLNASTASRYTLTGNFGLRIITLCMFYVAQGLPFGFVTMALKNYLHAKGISAEETGKMISMISLPWAFKFVWGPIIDSLGIPSMGRRRPWLILAQAAAALSLLGLAFMPGLESNMSLLGWAICLVNVFLSLQDVSADALAVDLLSEQERGKVNGFMYGSSYLGSWFGGVGIGYLLTRDGGSLQVALLAMAACVGAIMLLPLLFRERAGEKLLPWSEGSVQIAAEEAGAESISDLFGLLTAAFSRPVAILAAVFAVLFYIANAVLVVVASKYFVSEVGWTDDAFSSMEGWAIFASLAGSIAGGFVADQLGAKRSLVISGSLLGLCWVVFALNASHWDSKTFVTVFYWLQATFLGLTTVAAFSMFMGISDRRVAGTQFTAYMAILNCSTMIGSRIVGRVNELIPEMNNVYLIAGLFQLGVMLFVLLCIHPPRAATGAGGDSISPVVD